MSNGTPIPAPAPDEQVPLVELFAVPDPDSGTSLLSFGLRNGQPVLTVRDREGRIWLQLDSDGPKCGSWWKLPDGTAPKWEHVSPTLRLFDPANGTCVLELGSTEAGTGGNISIINGKEQVGVNLDAIERGGGIAIYDTGGEGERVAVELSVDADRAGHGSVYLGDRNHYGMRLGPS